MNTRIYNATIFDGHSIRYNAAIGIVDGKFTEVGDIIFDEQIDLGEDWLIPGFVDLQLYGGNGVLFSDAPSIASLKSMYAYSLAGGATSILPTVATNSFDIIMQAIEAVKAYQQQDLPGIIGLHLEGPFINPVKRGAHLEKYICTPTLAMAEQITRAGNGIVKMITLAPECCDENIIRHFISHGIFVSAGHSNASLEEAGKGFANGISLVTHLFNAMSPLNHRMPGLPGAALLSDTVMSSIVPDGYHVHFDMVKLAARLMPERLFIITDAVTDATGVYPHRLHEDRYVLADGTLSGSALTMLKAVRNCITQAGISMTDTFRMASLYPAKAIGMADRLGRIQEDWAADCIRLNAGLELKMVVKEGLVIPL